MRRVLTTVTALVAVVSLAACGDKSNVPDDETAQVQRGAQLFAERCHGCHTLDAVGAEGGASDVRDRERVDGPNFNVRVETKDNVLYAVRNGGYSGAIMPENIVVGDDADAVAAFLAKYSGQQAKEQRQTDDNQTQDTQ